MNTVTNFSITASKAELLKVLGRKDLQRIAHSDSIPILRSVLLTADKGGLRVSATDLFTSLTTTGSTAVRSTVPGRLVAPAKLLLERLRAMPEGSITLAGQVDQLILSGGNREFRLYTMPADDFPTLPSPSDTPDDPKAAVRRQCTVPASVLADLINRTETCISTDFTRPHLASALLEYDGTDLRCVSTDGHRLAKYDHAIRLTCEPFSVLIAQAGIIEIKRLCEDLKKDPKAQINVTVNGIGEIIKGKPDWRNLAGIAHFAHESTTLSVKLTGAQFPSYAQLIPARCEDYAIIDRATLAESLTSLAVCAPKRSGAIKLVFGQGQVEISCYDPDAGKAKDKIAIQYTGAPRTIGVNVQYVLEALAEIPEAEVRIGLSDALDPIVIEPVSARKALYLVMPMRT